MSTDRVAVVRRDGERGSATLALVVAAGLALVVFVTLVDVVTMQFTRSVLRAAADEAVRVGSRADAPVAACEARARSVLEGLLGRTLRARVSFTCGVSGTPPVVDARGELTLVPWLPGLPEWPLVVRSTAVQEALR
ncbi:MAG: hypothetical protein ACKOA9_12495 [Actinomycetota bacterium]